MARRRIVVQKDDVLIIGGVEVDAEILREIVNPQKRLLWYFIRRDNGDCQPVAVSEDQCIWLTDDDLVRTEAPNDV